MKYLFSLLVALVTAIAWAADAPKTVLAESGSGRVVYPTNFWTGNSTSINAVVTNRIPSGGTSGQSLVKASDTNYDVTWSTITGGEGGGAPTSASYLVLGADGTLTSERVFTPGTGLSYSDAGAGGAYTLSVSYGTTSGTAAQGNDARLSDARTPTAHTHGLAEITDEGTAASRNVPASGDAGSTEVVLGSDTRLTNARTPTTHTHGLVDITDEGTAASRNVPASGNASATEVVLGNDSRLTDARTPTTHSHNWLVPAGGSTGQSLTKASGSDGDLAWATVAGGSSPTTTRGDMIARGASADARLAIGPRAAFLQSDGSDPVWRGPHNSTYFFDDWLSDAATGQTGWTAGAGGGSATIREGTADRPGQASLETSTSASAAPYLRKTAGPPIKLGGGLLLARFAVETVTALSDGTETYTLRIGLGSSATAEPADGVYFTYSHGVNSGKWYCVNRKSSSDTGLDSGVSVANATWYDLAIVVNADASRVDFYIDSVLVASETTAANITSAAIGPFIHIIKSAGTTDRRIRIDYYEFYKELTIARQ